MPLAASRSAACKANPTAFEYVTIVMCSPVTSDNECHIILQLLNFIPGRSILATPIGMRNSLDITSSVTGCSTPYSNSLSRTTTGLSSLMADLRRPLASSEEYGVTTFKTPWLLQHVYSL